MQALTISLHQSQNFPLCNAYKGTDRLSKRQVNNLPRGIASATVSSQCTSRTEAISLCRRTSPQEGPLYYKARYRPSLTSIMRSKGSCGNHLRDLSVGKNSWSRSCIPLHSNYLWPPQGSPSLRNTSRSGKGCARAERDSGSLHHTRSMAKASRKQRTMYLGEARGLVSCAGKGPLGL